MQTLVQQLKDQIHQTVKTLMECNLCQWHQPCLPLDLDLYFSLVYTNQTDTITSYFRKRYNRKNAKVKVFIFWKN